MASIIASHNNHLLAKKIKATYLLPENVIAARKNPVRSLENAKLKESCIKQQSREKTTQKKNPTSASLKANLSQDTTTTPTLLEIRSTETAPH